jgi:hypothetical protein
MKTCSLVAFALLQCVIAQAQQRPRTHPLAGNPIRDLKGTVAAVHAVRGQGMPCIELKTGPKTTTVYLGSMRYLMQQAFNPRAGEVLEVRGYEVKGDIYAASVRVPATGKTFQFRDKDGWPLWSGGRRGRR